VVPVKVPERGVTCEHIGQVVEPVRAIFRSRYRGDTRVHQLDERARGFAQPEPLLFLSKRLTADQYVGLPEDPIFEAILASEGFDDPVRANPVTNN
jgi:hypothetical protein